MSEYKKKILILTKTLCSKFKNFLTAGTVVILIIILSNTLWFKVKNFLTASMWKDQYIYIYIIYIIVYYFISDQNIIWLSSELLTFEKVNHKWITNIETMTRGTCKIQIFNSQLTMYGCWSCIHCKNTWMYVYISLKNSFFAIFSVLLCFNILHTISIHHKACLSASLEWSIRLLSLSSCWSAYCWTILPLVLNLVLSSWLRHCHRTAHNHGYRAGTVTVGTLS